MKTKDFLWCEFYKFFHSRKMLLVCLFAVVIALYTYAETAGKECLEVYVLSQDISEDSDIGAQMCYDMLKYGFSGGYISGVLWFEAEAMYLFEEGGALSESWKSFDFPHNAERMQKIDENFGPVDKKDFKGYWKFTYMLEDSFAGVFSAIILAVFFFGTEYVCRGYSSICFAGGDRRKIFWSKYLVYAMLYFGLWLAEMALGILLYNRDIIYLSAGYVCKGLFLRFIRDYGVMLLVIPIVLLCRDEKKSFAGAFLFSFIFLNVKSFLYLNPYRFVTAEFWETLSGGNVAGKLIILTLLFFLGTGILSMEIFRRQELK